MTTYLQRVVSSKRAQNSFYSAHTCVYKDATRTSDYVFDRICLILLVHYASIVPSSKSSVFVVITLPLIDLLLHRTDSHNWVCLLANLSSRRRSLEPTDMKF